MSASVDTIRNLAEQDYKWGFVTEIDEDRVPKGLNEETIRLISARKGEPEFMLEWRLNALRHWSKMEREEGAPKWANLTIAPIDYQDIVYYSAPKQKPVVDSLDAIDPELLRTYEKLGIPLDEQKRLSGVAVDAVFDSVSVATTFKGKLAEMGVIFCSFSEAVQKHPELVKKYLGTVVPHTDNFYAALNAAVFTDGSFVYVPKGVRCPMELFDLLPHQRGGDGAVRAHADCCRRGRVRELPGRLHGADSRHEPVARRGGGAGGAGQCADQVLDRAELVPRRQGRARRNL